jgi:hypothetical protein
MNVAAWIHIRQSRSSGHAPSNDVFWRECVENLRNSRNPRGPFVAGNARIRCPAIFLSADSAFVLIDATRATGIEYRVIELLATDIKQVSG